LEVEAWLDLRAFATGASLSSSSALRFDIIKIDAELELQKK
jgi:hypothetical protein